jgi:signal transduction histidine kinase
VILSTGRLMPSLRSLLEDVVRLPRRPARSIALATAAVLLVGVLDTSTGPYLSMNLLYLVPVSWVTARVGTRAGLAVSAIAALGAAASDVVFQLRSAHPSVAIANVSFLAVTLVAVVALVAALRDRAAAARAAEQQSQEFLGFAAHQLRAPLARISGGIDALVLSNPAPPDRDVMLAQLGSESIRAGKLVRGLLSAARTNLQAVATEVVDLTSLVEVEVGRAAHAHGELVWKLHGAGSASVAVVASPDALAEALANLLENAAVHARTSVTVRIGRHRDRLEVAVSDDGPGVPSAQVERIFEPFVTLGGEGSGLGLPIARSIARAHGGSLSYRRTEGFVLRLRAETGADHRARDCGDQARAQISSGVAHAHRCSGENL